MSKMRSAIVVAVMMWGVSFAAVAELKIGVVGVQRLMNESPQAVAANAKLKREFSGREGDLVSQQREIQEKEGKLSRDGAIMTQQEVQAMEKDLLARKRELKRLEEAFREDVDLRRGQELETLQRAVLTAIDSLRKEENYDLILNEGVMYFSPRIDLTDKVLERLKKASAAAPVK